MAIEFRTIQPLVNDEVASEILRQKDGLQKPIKNHGIKKNPALSTGDERISQPPIHRMIRASPNFFEFLAKSARLFDAKDLPFYSVFLRRMREWGNDPKYPLVIMSK